MTRHNLQALLFFVVVVVIVVVVHCFCCWSCCRFDMFVCGLAKFPTLSQAQYLIATWGQAGRPRRPTTDER